MRRTTIILPPKLKRDAARLARERGLSLGELIRDSLAQRLVAEGPPNRDALFADHFTFRDDGPADVASNLDKYLAEADDVANRGG
jgi:hypothetical protein